MSTCPSCSTEASPQETVCPSCGAPLLTPGGTAAAAPVQASASRNRRWFFKILSVCMIAIGGCTAVLYPFVQQAREAANRTSCKCMLNQIGLALHTYHDQYGSFPPAFVRGSDGRPWHSWRVLILPYLDQADLYKQYSFSEPWDGPNNIKLLPHRPSIFDCPIRCEPTGASRPLLAYTGILACGSGWRRSGMTTSFAAAFGSDCIFRGSEPVTTKDVTDSTTGTIMIGELSDAMIPWTKPEDIDVGLHPHIGDSLGFSTSGRHGGAYFLMADGTSRWLKSDTPQQTVDALFTRDGGETSGDY